MFRRVLFLSTEYRDARADGDEKRLRGLLQDGSDRKIRSLEPGDN